MFSKSLSVCFLTLFVCAVAAEAAFATGVAEYNYAKDGLALGGYDPVSYFKGGAGGGPVQGKKEITVDIGRGITYRFASEENRKEFLANPGKYTPAYGGWCASAMAQGKKVEVDPLNYKITDGRLFLFFKAWYANALNDWNKDEKTLTSKADAAWKKISGE